MAEDILVDTKEFVATVTINRPEALNALTIDLRNQLGLLLDELNKMTSVKVIILTGAGERAFSAGLDLKELSTNEDTLKSIYDRKKFTDPVESINHNFLRSMNSDGFIACSLHASMYFALVPKMVMSKS